MIRWAARVLAANEHMIRAMVHERAGSIMRWTGLDETLANKIIDGLDGMLVRNGGRPRSPAARQGRVEGLRRLAFDLQEKPSLRDKVEAFKLEMIDNPALRNGSTGYGRPRAPRCCAPRAIPTPRWPGASAKHCGSSATTLQQDARLAEAVNRFARRAAVGTAADYGDGIVRLGFGHDPRLGRADDHRPARECGRARSAIYPDQRHARRRARWPVDSRRGRAALR